MLKSPVFTIFILNSVTILYRLCSLNFFLYNSNIFLDLFIIHNLQQLRIKQKLKLEEPKLIKSLSICLNAPIVTIQRIVNVINNTNIALVNVATCQLFYSVRRCIFTVRTTGLITSFATTRIVAFIRIRKSRRYLTSVRLVTIFTVRRPCSVIPGRWLRHKCVFTKLNMYKSIYGRCRSSEACKFVQINTVTIR